MTKVKYSDLGISDYAEVLEIQEKLFNAKVELKALGQTSENHLIFVEHKPVLTIGKSGKSENLIADKEKLKSLDIEVHRISRGGDITFHGPGQIVIYPILDLEEYNVSIKEYVFSLEELVIKTVGFYGIKAYRISGATGIWVQNGNEENKICAIGIKASRYITMHGIALNVNNNLNYFNLINPCGFKDKWVTSLSKELKKDIEISEVKLLLIKEFENIFKCKIV